MAARKEAAGTSPAASAPVGYTGPEDAIGEAPTTIDYSDRLGAGYESHETLPDGSLVAQAPRAGVTVESGPRKA